MTDVRFKISSPWIIYVSELNALFANDPDITIEYNNDSVSVRLFVDNDRKAAALMGLLPFQKRFGNDILNIVVISSNDSIEEEEREDSFFATTETEKVKSLITMQDYFEAAFENNPIFAFTHVVEGIFSNTLTYVVFKNRVVQFFADNLNDIHGNISTLYQELAKDVFSMERCPNVFFCTDIEEKVGKPLGEWP